MFVPKIFDIIIPDTSLKEIEDYFYNQEKLKNKYKKISNLKKGF